MTKPLTVARQEFASELVELINGAELPAFVIGEILKSALQEVERLSQAQYEQDAKSYRESQETKDEDSND